MRSKYSTILILMAIIAFSFTPRSSYGLQMGEKAKRTKVVYIETPSMCYQVDKVDGERVFLERSTGNCIEAPGKLPVNIQRDLREIDIYVDGKLWKTRELNDFGVGSIRDYGASVEGMKNSISGDTKPIQDETAEKAARDMAADFYSDSFQARIKDEEMRLKRDLFGDALKDYYPEALGESKSSGKKAYLAHDERIYVFISSSMPMTTIRNYMAAIDRVGDPNIKVVMRGLIGGMKYVKPTLEFVAEATLKDRHCDYQDGKECQRYAVDIDVDPLLFRRYQITKVPAVVYVPKVKRVDDPGMSEGLVKSFEVGEHYVVYGDASLSYVVDLIRLNARKQHLDRLARALAGEQPQ